MIRVNLQQFKIAFIIKTLTYFIGFFSFAVVFNHINMFYSSLFITMAGLSLYIEFKNLTIPRWLLTAFSVLIIVFFIYVLDMNNFVEQMMEALLMLLGIKFLEQKQVRDYMQIYAISLFLLSGLGLVISGIIFVVYILLFIVLLSVAFVFLTYYSQDSNLEFTQQVTKKVVLKCLLIPALAIPLSIILFIILPRSQYPLLDFLNRPNKATTGFTDNVRLGTISDIQEDTSIIFRAAMDKIDERDLYWRGITLDYFDGASWKTTTGKTYSQSSLNKPSVSGKNVKQVIYLEPYNNTYYFGLDKPDVISQRHIRKRADFTFVAPVYIAKKIRYEVQSVISDTIHDDHIDEQKYLQIPEGMSQNIINLTKSLMAGSDKEKTVQNLFRYLNNGQFRYSLKGLPVSKNPLENFLFTSKYGNCEFFASALSIMLRVAGVPSRMVGGYRGGYYNEVGRYYLVPQKNAHVWVEAFIPQKGWVRVDPTPTSVDTFSASKKGNIFLKVSIFFDTINYYWNTIIINYNLQSQLSIARSIYKGLRKPSLPFSLTRHHVAISFIVIALLSLAAFLIKSLTLNKKTKEMKILSRFLRSMERAGYKKTNSQGLEEFVASLHNEKLKSHALRFVKTYEKLYYTDTKLDKKDIRNLEMILNDIKRAI